MRARTSPRPTVVPCRPTASCGHTWSPAVPRGNLQRMKRILPVDELARDERVSRIKIEDVVFDPRNATVRQSAKDNRQGFRIENEEAPDSARSLMHGIFVG